MRNRRVAAILAVLICNAVPFGACAGVSLQAAERLKGELMPLGGDRTGNAEGTIPSWQRGLTQTPPGFKGLGSRYIDPFTSDQPRFTITAANLGQYKDRLTPGQLALLDKYPETYKIQVYDSRRTLANPEFIYEATFRNATEAELLSGGEGLTGASTGIPFPIPQSGHHAIWNHKLRYRGQQIRRWNNLFSVAPSGEHNFVRLKEEVRFLYNKPGTPREDLRNMLLYYLQVMIEPKRLAGTGVLVHETLDQAKEGRRAWYFNPKYRRLRQAPSLAYDNPIGAVGSNDSTSDQFDMFNGAMDRYAWKLLGKKEAYMPYNAYRVHSDQLKYSDIVKPQHVN